jgi:hypothetical protein
MQHNIAAPAAAERIFPIKHGNDFMGYGIFQHNYGIFAPFSKAHGRKTPPCRRNEKKRHGDTQSKKKNGNPFR